MFTMARAVATAPRRPGRPLPTGSPQRREFRNSAPKLTEYSCRCSGMAAFTIDEPPPPWINPPRRSWMPPPTSCAGCKQPRSGNCWPRSSRSAPTGATAGHRALPHLDRSARRGGDARLHARLVQPRRRVEPRRRARQCHPGLSHRARAEPRLRSRRDQPRPAARAARRAPDGPAPSGPTRCSRTRRASP